MTELADRGWLKRESARARSRISNLLARARPVVTGGSFASSPAIRVEGDPLRAHDVHPP